MYTVPQEIDQKVARLKLSSLSVEIEKLTEKQIQYLSSWEMGT
ncbi:MAG: adenosylhomocysteinase [Atribacterota bacterium]